MNVDITLFALLSPHVQEGLSCFCSGTGGGVKWGDEPLGALVCSKETGFKTAFTFSSCLPGNCRAISREMGVVARGRLVKGAEEVLGWACSLPEPFLSF